MAITPSGIPGQAPNSNRKSRRTASTRQPGPPRKGIFDNGASIASESSASGLNKRALRPILGREASLTAAPGGPHGVDGMAIPRKKLPWLDGQKGSRIVEGPGFMPGGFDSQLSLATAVVPQGPPKEREQNAETLTKVEHTPTSKVLNPEPALHANGSTPSLRPEKKTPVAGHWYLSSTSRAGVRPPRAKDGLVHFMTPKKPKKQPKPIDIAETSPSEYSATMSSTEPASSSAGSARQDPASHDRLVQQSSDSYSQYVAAKAELRAQGVHTTWNPVIPGYGSEASHPSSPSCTSCDHEVELRELPAVDTMSRRATSPVNDEIPLPRRQTITGMPQHMMLSTSEAPSSSEPPISPERATTRKNTLMPFPEHLDPSPLPSSAASSVQPAELDNAVTGLGNLMDQAVLMAQEAAEHGQSDEVTKVLDNATVALRRASTVRTKMSQPLIMTAMTSSPPTSPYAAPTRPASQFDSEAFVDASDDLTDDDSTVEYLESYSGSDNSTPAHSRSNSDETAPTVFTASAQPSRRPLGPQNDAALTSNETGSHISIRATPPLLYHPPSAESVVRDFAYWSPSPENIRRAMRNSLQEPAPTHPSAQIQLMSLERRPLVTIDPEEAVIVPVSRHSSHSSGSSSRSNGVGVAPEAGHSHLRKRIEQHPHILHAVTATQMDQPRRMDSTATATGPDDTPPTQLTSSNPPFATGGNQSNSSNNPGIDLRHPRRRHISLRENQGFSLGRHHKRQPIAREWNLYRKRITAVIACANTVFIGLISGIYAGEVPRIQYQLADMHHNVILGNVLLYIGLALTTLLAWPLPLLHGRKPYTLLAFAVMLPLQFPQAIVVSSYRAPNNATYRVGLLLPRVLTGIAMGFANINFMPTFLDLFGASLMSYKPHQEFVTPDDVRRQGGGMGMWLGLWSWCFVGSLSIGFWIGATIIESLDPGWGFYIVVILLALFMLINVVAPETRRAPYRRSIHHFLDGDERVRRRVARGEVKLHISNEGPKWWWQEAWAGVVLMKRMVMQPGFAVMMVYLAWIYCQVVFVILLLGALMSRDYRWTPAYVGLAALSIAIGAFFAIPLSHANLFSRSRFEPQRTDSMTFQPSVTWSSHLLRRSLFSILLPFAGLAYTLASPGQSVHWGVPCTMAGLVGFLSNLAISECVGIIMETFDTCDLQPGVNTKHRLQSLGEVNLRRRTNYSAFPRICAGFFAAQGLGFFLAAAATGVSGDITRSLGAQTTTAIVAGILLVITILFILVLSRFKEVQVIPDGALGSRRGSKNVFGASAVPEVSDAEFRAVVIGKPSGKVRRMNVLELGALSRWTEIRRLNRLLPSIATGKGGRGGGMRA